MRPNSHIAFYRKRISISGRKTVTPFVCPLRKMIPFGRAGCQRQLRAVSHFSVYTAVGHIPHCQIIYICGNTVIVGDNGNPLPFGTCDITFPPVLFF
ncbi:hypothetical protein Barb6_03247 [Bacteroidales bacterium Barb6]|nr:hypothetical protein Barb6_03247 [Bacteroidales bacterium Barb6]